MKKFFKFLFKGLYSNEEILQGSRERPFWMALIFLLVSLIISVVPAFVSIANTSGSSVITSTTNASLDRSLVLFNQYLKENNIELTIDANGNLDNSVEINPTGSDKYEYCVVVPSRTSEDASATTELLAVRVITDADIATYGGETAAITTYQSMYASGKTTVAQETNSTTPRSYMLLSKTYIYLATYLSTATNTLGDDGTITTYATANATFGGVTACAKDTNITSFYTTAAEQSTCLTNWETFFDNLYSSSKTSYLWGYTGLILVLNLAVVLIVSLLIMILTRLKSATGDKLNYIEALKVACFASVSPAIITLIVGFIMSQLAQIGFILCLGLRSTFLGMRASNPERYANQ